MITASLPWPPAALSPNSRKHWVPLARAKAAYREECRCITLAARVGTPAAGPLHLAITFRPPSRRQYDRDNLLARIKAGLDGLADALEIDDARFEQVTIRLGAKVAGGRVDLEIYAAAKENPCPECGRR